MKNLSRPTTFCITLELLCSDFNGKGSILFRRNRSVGELQKRSIVIRQLYANDRKQRSVGVCCVYVTNASFVTNTGQPALMTISRKLHLSAFGTCRVQQAAKASTFGLHPTLIMAPPKRTTTTGLTKSPDNKLFLSDAVLAHHDRYPAAPE